MVRSCVGLLCLLPGDNFAGQGCVSDYRWSMAVIQLGVHDRVGHAKGVDSLLCSLRIHVTAFANVICIVSD